MVSYTVATSLRKSNEDFLNIAYHPERKREKNVTSYCLETVCSYTDIVNYLNGRSLSVDNKDDHSAEPGARDKLACSNLS